MKDASVITGRFITVFRMGRTIGSSIQILPFGTPSLLKDGAPTQT
jgi:hypothetical protein